MGTEADSKSRKEFEGLWIPKDILDILELTINDRVVLSVICMLSQKKPAFPSNKYISEVLKISERTVVRSLSKLLNLKLITNEGFDGRKRYLSVNNEVIRSKNNKGIGATAQKKLSNKGQFGDAVLTKSGIQDRQFDDHIIYNDKKENISDVLMKIKNEINIFFRKDNLNNQYLDGKLLNFLEWLSKKKEIENFKSQFAAYKKYKEATGERVHSILSFIGSPENEYHDGGWCSENWGEKFKQYKFNKHGKYNKRNSSINSRFRAEKIEHKEDSF